MSDAQSYRTICALQKWMGLTFYVCSSGNKPGYFEDISPMKEYLGRARN